MLKRPIQTNERNIRTINGIIENNAGTLAVLGGQGFSAVHDGTGQVTVTLDSPGKILVGISAIVINSTAATAHMVKVLDSTNAASVQFGTYVADATDGAPADVDFAFSISVKDSLI